MTAHAILAISIDAADKTLNANNLENSDIFEATEALPDSSSNFVFPFAGGFWVSFPLKRSKNVRR